MAIDPYEPGLAKRQTAFRIADKQLMNILSNIRSNPNKEIQEQFGDALEAMRDYKQTGEDLKEWIEQRQDQNSQ